MTLSTHILDTMHGTPAAGLRVRLKKGNLVLFEGQTDQDGRCPDLRTTAAGVGLFSLTFEVADYFVSRGVELPNPPFLDHVTIDFGIADETAHYHVPLLVSPYAYSTYRGS